MKYKRIKIIIIIGVVFMLLSGCSRQQLGYSILKMFGFTSDYSYLQEIEVGTELKISDDIEAIIRCDKHPQEGNDISFYSAQITKEDDINSIIEQISHNDHWSKTPLEANVSNVLSEDGVLEEAGFPKIKNGYYIFYWDFDDSTADEIEKVYGVPENRMSEINAETCKSLGYFDTDTNTIYFISFFENHLKL
jgi:hypothetical protein